MNIYKSFLVILATLFLHTSCKEEITYLPGTLEDQETEGVYFPLQTGYTNELVGLEFDTDDATQIEIKVSRTNMETSVDAVPFELDASHEGIFELSDITFAEGQTETTAILDFSKAEIGVEYTCNIVISDPKYVAVYGNKRTSLHVSLLVATWVQVVGANGETLGRWREDMLNMYKVNRFAEREIEIFEREDKPGIYRMNNIYDGAFLAECVNLDPSLVQNNWREASIIINASNPDKVFIEQQDMGYILNNQEGWISMSSHTPEGHSSFADAAKYGTLKDGVITFPKDGIVCYLENLYGRAYIENQFSMFRVMLPGVKEIDLSCVVKVGEPTGGKVNVDIAIGEDVMRVEYAYFEGRLTADEVNLKSIEMDSDITPVATITSDMNFDQSFEKTGLYTLVANVYGSNGVLAGSSYSNFGYIVNGDSKDVILSLGVDLTDKYISAGLTKENAAFPWIYGEDIEYAHYYFVKSRSVEGLTEREIIDEIVDYGISFDEEELEQINTEGLSFTIDNLHAASEYVLYVYAYNGYVHSLFEASVTTEGVYNILNEVFHFNHLGKIQDKENLFKLWNVWAVNHNDRENQNRQHLGSWTFSELEDVSIGKDIINLKGISLDEVLDDDITWEYYNGYILSHKAQKIGSFNSESGVYYLKYIPIDYLSGYLFEETDYTMIGGMVDDGYIAFVNNPAVDDEVNSNGILIGVYEDEECTSPVSNKGLYYDIILQDPNVEAPPMENVKAYTAELHELAAKMKNPNNYVELRGVERAKYFIDQTNKKKMKNLATKKLNLVSMPNAKQIIYE